MFEVRTDLTVEENERVKEQQQSSRGISVSEEAYGEDNIHITTVRIETENAVKTMGKPKGTYITLEAPRMAEDTEDYHRDISEKVAELLHRLIPIGKTPKSILVAGLGNRNVTPDALGPRVVDNLCITRHILKEYGTFAYGKARVEPLCAVAPGVMAQTGMETGEILSGVVREVKPDYLIAIDALAARSLKRLCRTIQISDTGISPGSGVGNHRHSLTAETLGVPVIAIGIPTVVEAATIVQDSMAAFLRELSGHDSASSLEKSWERLNEAEHRELVREMMAPQLNQMFVTSKDIDAQIKQMSYTVSEGINMAFFHS
ncbi:MAG: GPR endopeptidase [Lachnospiraceae bacterium]|nr:GPR endopeptidase [Lachnospiraceae bacterium]